MPNASAPVEKTTYGKRLSRASVKEYGKFWSGYRLLVTFSGLVAPLLLQFRRGVHSVLSVFEAVESSLIGLSLSLIGTYLYSRREAAEALDRQWEKENEQQRAQLAIKGSQIESLTVEVAELNKPKRTPFDEKEYQRIKNLTVGYDEDCIAVLQHLIRQERMARHASSAFENLPDGLDSQHADTALRKLLKDQVVTQEEITQGNIRRQQWTIAPRAKAALEELL